MISPNLSRVADDLELIHALGGLAPQRRESLRIAAAELRALAALRAARPVLIDRLEAVAAEVGPLLDALTSEPRK